MKFYVLVTSHATDYPEVNVPRVFIDRVVAIDAWRADVMEAEGYPDDVVDPNSIVDIGTSADEFLTDVEKNEVGWVVHSGTGIIEEMAHIQLFAIEEDKL